MSQLCMKTSSMELEYEEFSAQFQFSYHVVNNEPALTPNLYKMDTAAGPNSGMI